MSRILLLLIVLLATACSKGGDKQAPPTGSATTPPATGSAGAATPTQAPPTTAAPDLPSGPGPHQGYDLAAIHKRLQGTWLTGGSAFSSIPNVWSLDGNTLTEIDEKGNRTVSTLRMLAPCYFFAGAPGGGSGVYHHFVFDGDTLYLGLGSSGLVQGGKTIACMSAGIFVHDGTACTLWKRKPFAKPGNEWESEPGECGYSDDKQTFQTDDTNTSRKIYGVQKVNVKGGVLLTTQMEGNKAERFPSLDAALAKQKEKIDAKVALTKTPGDLPFKDWGVPSTDPGYEANSTVWGAAVTRDGKWGLHTYRYKKFEDGALWLMSMSDGWAPSAFVHAPEASKLSPGEPALLAIGALMPYGRVVKLDGDKVVVRYRSGNRLSEQTLEASRVLPLAKKAWVFGAPVAYKDGERWASGRLVLDGEADAYVFDGAAVTRRPKAELKLVDVGKKWSKGAKVWAMRDSGMSPLSYEAGTIDKAEGDVLYSIKTADGRSFQQTFDRIVDKL